MSSVGRRKKLYAPDVREAADRYVVIQGRVYEHGGVKLPFAKPTPLDCDRTVLFDGLSALAQRALLGNLKYVGKLARRISASELALHPSWVVVQSHVYNCLDYGSGDITEMFEALEPQARRQMAQRLLRTRVGILQSAPAALTYGQYVDHSLGLEQIFGSLEPPPSPRLVLNQYALLFLSCIVNDLSLHISHLSVTLCEHARQKTISSRTIQSAFRSIPWPNSMVQKCVSSATRDVTSYNSDGHHETVLSLSALSTLLSSADFFREHRYSEGAAVYLGGGLRHVVECILHEASRSVDQGHEVRLALLSAAQSCLGSLPLPQTSSLCRTFDESSNSVIDEYIQSLGPASKELFQVDLEVRRSFCRVPPSNDILQPCATLISPWTMYSAIPFGDELLSVLLSENQASQFRLVDNGAIFKERLALHTCGLLDHDFFVPGLYLAGGSVLRWLLEDPKGFIGSDYDVFFINALSPSQAERLLQQSIDKLKVKAQLHGAEVKEHSSDYAVSVDIYWGIVHIIVQFVTRIYRSPAEVLTGFDLDSCSVGFDGEKLMCTTRFARSLATRCNYVDLTRRSLTYEYRLWKYSRRGFAVRCLVPHGFEDQVRRAWDVDHAHASQGLGRLLAYHVGLLPSKKRDRHPSDYASRSLVQKENSFRSSGDNKSLRHHWVTTNPGSQGHLVGSFHPIPPTQWTIDMFQTPQYDSFGAASKSSDLCQGSDSLCKLLKVQQLRAQREELQRAYAGLCVAQDVIVSQMVPCSIRDEYAIFQESCKALFQAEECMSPERDSLRESTLILAQRVGASCEASLLTDITILDQFETRGGLNSQQNRKDPDRILHEPFEQQTMRYCDETNAMMHLVHQKKRAMAKLQEDIESACLVVGGQTDKLEELSILQKECTQQEQRLLDLLERETHALVACNKVFLTSCEKISLHLLSLEDSIKKRVSEHCSWMDFISRKAKELALTLHIGAARFEVQRVVVKRSAELNEAKQRLEVAAMEIKSMKMVVTGNCGQCEGDSTALFCLDCKENYCEACFSNVHKRGKLVSHVRHRIGDDPLAVLSPLKNQVAIARSFLEEEVRKLNDIRLAGYPELKCLLTAAVSKQPHLREEVPTIDREDLEVFGRVDDCAIIGEGGVAQVHRVEILVTGFVAFKRFKYGIDASVMKKEASAVFHLRHPNIVHLYGVCIAPGLTGLVLELVEGGSLAQILSAGPSLLNKNKLCSILRAVCHGLGFIHSQHYLHLDVKAANVLVSHDFHVVKLSDFGSAQELRNTIAFLTMAPELTLRWAAPERLQELAILSAAADVWSLGMLLLEMCTSQQPFSSVADDLRILTLVLNEKQTPSIPPHVDPVFARLMKECWAFVPQERISVDSLQKALDFEMRRDCIVCWESCPLFTGCECNSYDALHFVCSSCLHDFMHEMLSNDCKVPEEGFVPCPGRDCLGFVAADALPELLSPSFLIKWHSASATSRLRQTEMRHSIRIRELETQVKLGPILRHVHSITTRVLTDACPRCKTAFFDFSGCFALHCSNPTCSCAFCGWCLQDCGSNAHNHVRSCPFKLNKSNYFGSWEDFEACKKSRQLRGLLEAMLSIPELSLRRSVWEELLPCLSQYSSEDFRLSGLNCLFEKEVKIHF